MRDHDDSFNHRMVDVQYEAQGSKKISEENNTEIITKPKTLFSKIVYAFYFFRIRPKT